LALQGKKRQILDAAIHCFARKGFHATSIQEIVDELGMAKGSIYFYFKSKDDLLISVFEYYVDKLYGRMEGLPDEWGLPPREKLSLQLERQFQFFREHVDFMRMLMTEPLHGLHPHIQQLMHHLRARNKLWHLSHLMAIYGKSAERHFGDASALLSGIVITYHESILLGVAEFDERRLSRYLVQRLDDLMAGIEKAGEAPILPGLDIAQLRTLAGIDSEPVGEEVQFLHEVIASLTNSEGSWDEQTSADLLAAAGILLEEAANPLQTNPLLVRGMIALLNQEGLQEWQAPLEKLQIGLMKR
jgi:AcrR family transcriptional regulator